VVIEQGRRRCALFALAVCSRRLLLFWRWFDGGLLVAAAASHSRRGGFRLGAVTGKMELVQPWLLREEEDGCGGDYGNRAGTVAVVLQMRRLFPA